MRPVVDDNLESNVRGIFLAGSIIDAPCIRASANQGHRVAESVAGLVKGSRPAPGGPLDLLIAGAGAAGLNAAMTAKRKGLSFVIIDQYFTGSTLLGMPEGKVFDVHYKGNNDPPEGEIRYETSPAPVLHGRWTEQLGEMDIAVNEHEALVDIERDELTGVLEVRTIRGVHRARHVLIAVGKSGAPRHLNVLGEFTLKQKRRLHYKFRGVGHYKGKNILVVGGGNTAAEAALALSQHNHVTMSYRKGELERLTDRNRATIEGLAADNKVHLLLNTNVLRFDGDKVVLLVEGDIKVRSFDEYFILIGFEPPFELLSRIGIELE